MKVIQSSENPRFKLLKQLGLKKYRDKFGLYLIEGENLVFEAQRNGALIDEIFVKESLENKKFEGTILSDNLFDQVAQTETSQGYLAIVKKQEENKIEKGCYVVLDRLQDPGNIGTIIRTADASGFSGVIVLKGTADIYSPKVVRAAAGSLFREKLFYINDAKELKKLSEENGLRIVATSLDAKKMYYEENLKEDVLIVIGNEGNGISKELLDLADCKIKIPMATNIESLNASIAAAIVMYERMRG